MSRTGSLLETSLTKQMQLMGLPMDADFQKGCFIFIFFFVCCGVFFSLFCSFLFFFTGHSPLTGRKLLLGKSNS